MPNDDKEFIIPLDKFPNLLEIAQMHDLNVTPWSRFKESVIDMHTEGVKKQELIAYINTAYDTLEVEEDGQLKLPL